MASKRFRHNCDRDGCFNKKYAPNLEEFDECFLGKNAFGNIDGFIERNRHFLFFEWKSPGQEVGYGQRTGFERLTELPRVTFLIIYGDCPTMRVDSFSVIRDGGWKDMGSTSLQGLKKFFIDWETNVLKT